MILPCVRGHQIKWFVGDLWLQRGQKHLWCLEHIETELTSISAHTDTEISSYVRVLSLWLIYETASLLRSAYIKSGHMTSVELKQLLRCCLTTRDNQEIKTTKYNQKIAFRCLSDTSNQAELSLLPAEKVILCYRMQKKCSNHALCQQKQKISC